MLKAQNEIELISGNAPLIIKEEENSSPSKGTLVFGSPV